MEYKEERIDGYLVSDIECCVGKNKNFYINRFRDISQGRKTFNFASAFLSTYWLSYRLMIWEALILIVINSFIEILLLLYLLENIGYNRSLFFAELLCYLFIGAIYTVILGYLGDRLYWSHVKRKLNSCDCKNKEKNPETQLQLARIGGTGIVTIILCILVTPVASALCEKIVYWFIYTRI